MKTRLNGDVAAINDALEKYMNTVEKDLYSADIPSLNSFYAGRCPLQNSFTNLVLQRIVADEHISCSAIFFVNLIFSAQLGKFSSNPLLFSEIRICSFHHLPSAGTVPQY